MVFCHISTRISHRYTRVPSLPNLSHLPLHPTPQPVLETLLEFPESYSNFKPAFSFSFTVTRSCPILCMPIDCSLPGSSVHGISQIKILEWVSISSSRESSQPSDQICVFAESQTRLSDFHFTTLLNNREELRVDPPHRK